MASTVPPATDHGLARWLAWRSGQRLLALRARIGYADPPALRDAGDAGSHELIMDELVRWRPSDAVLSEEGADDPGRLSSERVWIVDPLDGTTEFAEPNRVDWAVHIGLWAHGRLVAGAVGLPARHRVLATETPPPYPPINDDGSIRIAVSRTRPPAFLGELSAALGGAIFVPTGSAGVKAAAVIDGDVDAYVHVGVLHEWDFAAPVAVAIATGLHASRLDGAGLRYNQPDPTVPDLLICRKDLVARLLVGLRACGIGGGDTGGGGTGAPLDA
ncbi:MAG: 3'(2'),5'-bisphosphate nucleotidase CysQ [Dactylosporangium sp.]|nr:3'(2'),5'-bisphosphate nucleotidase CysQ [Dactylosporangium sp.]NNJ61630.1 3'(2'),5'-bisphosphate nucleotidase CysQ [Dactylosporangium sp.]